MAITRSLDNILNSNSKLKIIRLFISRGNNFIASGRETARLTKISPPAAHAALNDLYNQNILKRDILGKQHIYRLNSNNRVVKKILIPAFTSEISIKEDIFEFLRQKIKEKKMSGDLLSLILYGSLQKGAPDAKSDVDIAVITKNKICKRKVEKMFIEDIAEQFHDYLGLHLDVYIKSKDEFINRLKKNLPPVSSLIRSYSVIYGKDPLDFIT